MPDMVYVPVKAVEFDPRRVVAIVPVLFSTTQASHSEPLPVFLGFVRVFHLLACVQRMVIAQRKPKSLNCLSGARLLRAAQRAKRMR